MAGEAKKQTQVVALLERIDNQLSLAEDSQKEASFALLAGHDFAMWGIDTVIDDLKEPNCTCFERSRNWNTFSGESAAVSVSIMRPN